MNLGSLSGGALSNRVGPELDRAFSAPTSDLVRETLLGLRERSRVGSFYAGACDILIALNLVEVASWTQSSPTQRRAATFALTELGRQVAESLAEAAK